MATQFAGSMQSTLSESDFVLHRISERSEYASEQKSMAQAVSESVSVSPSPQAAEHVSQKVAESHFDWASAVERGRPNNSRTWIRAYWHVVMACFSWLLTLAGCAVTFVAMNGARPLVENLGGLTEETMGNILLHICITSTIISNTCGVLPGVINGSSQWISTVRVFVGMTFILAVIFTHWSELASTYLVFLSEICEHESSTAHSNYLLKWQDMFTTIMGGGLVGNAIGHINIPEYCNLDRQYDAGHHASHIMIGSMLTAWSQMVMLVCLTSAISKGKQQELEMVLRSRKDSDARKERKENKVEYETRRLKTPEGNIEFKRVPKRKPGDVEQDEDMKMKGESATPEHIWREHNSASSTRSASSSLLRHSTSSGDNLLLDSKEVEELRFDHANDLRTIAMLQDALQHLRHSQQDALQQAVVDGRNDPAANHVVIDVGSGKGSTNQADAKLSEDSPEKEQSALLKHTRRKLSKHKSRGEEDAEKEAEDAEKGLARKKLSKHKSRGEEDAEKEAEDAEKGLAMRRSRSLPAKAKHSSRKSKNADDHGERNELPDKAISNEQSNASARSASERPHKGHRSSKRKDDAPSKPGGSDEDHKDQGHHADEARDQPRDPRDSGRSQNRDSGRSQNRDSSHHEKKKRASDKDPDIHDKDRKHHRSSERLTPDKERDDGDRNYHDEGNRDREQGRSKDRDRDRYRDRDRERDQDSDLDDFFHELDRNREQDQERDEKKKRDHRRNRDEERDRDQEKHRDRDRERDRERDRDRYHDREKDRNHERDHDRNSYREQHQERDQEKHRDRDRERDRERDRDRYHDREKDRNHRDREREHDRERDRERYHDREKNRNHERDRNRDSYRDQDQERDKEKYRHKERDLERDRDRYHDRERHRGQDQGRDHEKDRDHDRHQRHSGGSNRLSGGSSGSRPDDSRRRHRVSSRQRELHDHSGEQVMDEPERFEGRRRKSTHAF